MSVLLSHVFRREIAHGQHLPWIRSPLGLVAVLIVRLALTEAQFINWPFITGLTALQSLFKGDVAKLASLIATVIGGNYTPDGLVDFKDCNIGPRLAASYDPRSSAWSRKSRILL